ncbi:MAG: hypothetical protein J1G38_04140 [Clostridiales bacterium]|nr:hypothetical protein [Clostridiales bacterium]
MNYTKTKIAAISTLATAALLVGLMIMLPLLPANIDAENGFAAFFLVIFGSWGWPAIYASGVPFVLVALVFGLKILLRRDDARLSSWIARMMIADFILSPVLVVGIILNYGPIFFSTLGAFPAIYAVLTLAAYVESLLAQIVALHALKTAPLA